MIQQLRQQRNAQVANDDPLFVLAELFIKIDQREKVIEQLQKDELNDESDKRSSDSTSQSE